MQHKHNAEQNLDAGHHQSWSEPRSLFGSDYVPAQLLCVCQKIICRGNSHGKCLMLSLSLTLRLTFYIAQGEEIFTN